VAMDAMARCGAKYVPALVELATSDDASIRADAVGRLDRMNDGAVTGKMLQIFAENQELRGGAQMFLKGRMRNGALTPAMLVPLLSSGDPDLRKMAAEMLNEGNRRYALGLATQRRINEILKPYSTSLGGQAVAWTVPASVAGDEDASAGSGGSDVFGFLKDLVTWATGALAALVTLVGLVWLLSERPMGRQRLVTEPAG